MSRRRSTVFDSPIQIVCTLPVKRHIKAIEVTIIVIEGYRPLVVLADLKILGRERRAQDSKLSVIMKTETESGRGDDFASEVTIQKNRHLLKSCLECYSTIL